jgi:serine/threonine-protein kinase
MPSFVQRLRERKIVHWAVVYLAGAWLFLEALGFVADNFGWPTYITRSAIVIAAVGFLAVLVLAWYHGEKGRQKASGVELLILAVIFVIAGAAVATFGRGGDEALERAGDQAELSAELIDARSVAVLPFVNMSADPENEYFSDGVTDAIITHLTKIAGLKVTSRTSIMQYKDPAGKSVREIAEELGVATIVEGTVQRTHGRVRVNAQLVDAESDEHLWAEIYDRDLTDIFAVQSDVAQQVAAALQATLTLAVKEEIERRLTDNLEAYDYYLRGLEFMQRGYAEPDLRIARGMFEEAAQLDSSFAHAYAKLSEVHTRLYWFRYDRSQECLVQAKLAADRSLELDPDLPEGHQALGYYHYHGHVDYEGAVREFEMALALQPGNSELFANMAYVERRRGDFESARAHLERATELGPRDAVIHWELAVTHSSLRNYAEAERYYDRALTLAPDMIWAYALKAWNRLNWDGNASAARSVFEEASDRGLDIIHDRFGGFIWAVADIWDGHYGAALERLSSGSLPVYDSQFYYYPKALFVAQIYGLMNEPELARQHYDSAAALLEDMVQEAPEDPRLYGALGIAYAGLGRVKDAVRAGERGIELLPMTKDHWMGMWRVGDLARILMMTGQYDASIDRIGFLLSVPGHNPTSVASLRVDPTWAPLRDHPRFQELVAKYE